MLTNRSAVLIVLSLCLAAGGTAHILDIARGGFLPYRFAPMSINVYWTSLAVLDLVTVLFLWRQLKIGIAFTLLIMLSDVTINSYVTYGLHIPVSFAPLQAQTLFLGFVLGCASFLWPRSNSNPSR